MAIGAPYNNGNGTDSGHVKVYQFDDITRDFIDIDTSVQCDSVIMSRSAPSNSSAVGIVGEIRVDDNYIYVFTANNTWKRASIATW